MSCLGILEMEHDSADEDANSDIEVIALWQLPDGFFNLDIDAQFKAVKLVTRKAPRLTEPRKSCKMSGADDAMMVIFFLVNLGLIWVLAIAMIVLFAIGSTYLKWSVAVFLAKVD